MHRAARGVLAALSAIAVVAAPTTGTASESFDEAAVVVDRIAGTDRWGTAALLAAEFPEGVDTVYIVNGETWAQGADAVVAGAAAGSGTVPPLLTDASGNPAPILLVRAGSIPSGTRAALKALQPSHAVIMGGESVVQPVVEAELVAAGIETVRVFGTDRYGTAAALAVTFEPGPETVYVASGVAIEPRHPRYHALIPDALTASARAGAEGVPVLLTRTFQLPPVTRAALEALDPASITIVGGNGTVSAGVEAELSQIAPVTRISGTTRYETAARLFESYAPGGPRTYLAAGTWFADALAVSALAASEGAPVLLSPDTHLHSATEDGLLALDPASVRLVGGTYVLDDAVMQQVRDVLDPAP